MVFLLSLTDLGDPGIILEMDLKNPELLLSGRSVEFLSLRILAQSQTLTRDS
jgi:hypothetical protein